VAASSCRFPRPGSPTRGLDVEQPWEWALEHLACPRCQGVLRAARVSDDRRQAVLAHADAACAERYPVIDGVPRLVIGSARGGVRGAHERWFSEFGSDLLTWPTAGAEARPDLRLVARFDEEWRSFSSVGSAELEKVFRMYFDVVPAEVLRDGAILLDAGCGAGRWAYQVQQHGARVIALDLGRSVEVAERNTRSSGRVACVQGDVRRPPLQEARFDLVYSLGVLHHIEETDEALRGLARLLRPGGSFLVYLYYSLETRGAAYKAAFRAVDAVRRLTSALPQSVLAVVATAIAAGVYWPLARLSAALRSVGLGPIAARVPLSFYGGASFRTMRNDSLDRFGTRLEKRFSRAQVEESLVRAGLTGVTVSPRAPYWHAVARRPA
jgi:SAM-dependent methyltransferase/uncharacterized protein YbaR (Trm112 family)